jgi:hypothetical protein
VRDETGFWQVAAANPLALCLPIHSRCRLGPIPLEGQQRSVGQTKELPRGIFVSSPPIVLEEELDRSRCCLEKIHRLFLGSLGVKSWVVRKFWRENFERQKTEGKLRCPNELEVVTCIISFSPGFIKAGSLR